MSDPRLSAEQPSGTSSEEGAQRDRQIAGALALFLFVMALLLLVALPFASLTIDRVLEVAAALTLAAVAALFLRLSKSGG